MKSGFTVIAAAVLGIATCNTLGAASVLVGGLAVLTTAQPGGTNTVVTEATAGFRDQNLNVATLSENVTMGTSNLSPIGIHIVANGINFPTLPVLQSELLTGHVVSDGRAVVAAYTSASGYENEFVPNGVNYGRVVVGGNTAESTNLFGPSSEYLILPASNGDAVIAQTSAMGLDAAGFGTAIFSIADAPAASISNDSAFLTPITGPVDPSVPVQVQFGVASLTSSRSLVQFPNYGNAPFTSASASPFRDQVDFIGTLLLNGAPIGGFDYPISFGAGNATTQQELSDDLTTVNVNFLQGTSVLKLDWSVVETAYDASGNPTTTLMESDSTSEIVSVPEPVSASLLGTIGFFLLLRRKRRNPGVVC